MANDKIRHQESDAALFRHKEGDQWQVVCIDLCLPPKGKASGGQAKAGVHDGRVRL